MMDAGASTRRGPRVAWLPHALLAAVVLLALLVAFWDWNWLKGPVERRVAASTGREFHFDDLDVDLGSVIVVRASGLTFANAPWSLATEMARADLVRAEIELGSLLRGRPLLRRIDVVRPGLLLERNARSEANWQFGKQAPGAEPEPRARRWRLGELRVHEGLLAVRDVPLGTALRLSVDSPATEQGARSVRLLLRGTGQYRRQPFVLDGWADSPIALLGGPDAAYRLDISARAGTTRGRVYGSLPVPVDVDRIELHTVLRGNDLADLYTLLGLAVPPSPPYRLEGRLERNGRQFALHDLQGRIGDSDITGEASIDLRSTKPMLTARLLSQHLDLDDLGGLIGLPPGVGEGESASPAQIAAAREREASPRLLPDNDFDLEKLNSLNANVRLDARHIDAGKWPINSLDARFLLRDGTLRIEPFEAAVAGGRVAGNLQLKAQKKPLGVSTRLDFEKLDLEKMWPEMQPPNVGRLQGVVDLRGQGNSVAEMLASADGTAQFAMGKGHFSNLLLELAGLDVAETLKFLIDKDKTVRLRCAYADFAVTDGKVDTRSLVFDTTDTVLFGSGKMDLDDETLALQIRPEPKDVSPVSLRGPLRISGTLKSPKFRPEAKPLLARIAAGVALYAIAPPAALLALIETGPGENVDCYRGPDGKDQKGGKQLQQTDRAEADEKK